ncbi:MAG: glycine zipper 2TM domain-containing protein [Steroidobacteraceae bacterium]
MNRPMLIAPFILLLAACGNNSPSPRDSAAPAADVPTEAPAEAPAPAETTPPMEDQASAELEARESEIAAREAELAEREAALAAQQAAANKPKPVAKAPRPATAPAAPRAPAAPPPPPAPVTVAVGTQLPIEVTAAVSTKTSTVGDRIEGKLASDVLVDGKTALRAGEIVQGSVTEVVSGSKKIGGVPTLGISFDKLVLTDGKTIALNGRLVQQGKSETGRDAAKIAGGVLVGAVVGHQIDDDKGKVIGGILGGAAGALIAKKTGGDVTLEPGTVLTVELTSPIEVIPAAR